MTASFVAAYSGEASRLPITGIDAALPEVNRCVMRVAHMRDGVLLRTFGVALPGELRRVSR